MVNMTFGIPDELDKLMKKHNIIKWSEVAREAIWEKAKLLEHLDNLTKNSELTEEDCIKIGREINKNIARRYGL